MKNWRKSNLKKMEASENWENLAAMDRLSARRRKRIQTLKIGLATLVAAAFAILFLMPIVLTITNSFMAAWFRICHGCQRGKGVHSGKGEPEIYS